MGEGPRESGATEAFPNALWQWLKNSINLLKITELSVFTDELYGM